MEKLFKKLVEDIGRIDDRGVEMASIRGIKKPLRKYVVYQLVLSDGKLYIGYSFQLKVRLKTHKKDKKIINNRTIIDYIILHHTDCKEEALQSERFYIHKTLDENINWDKTPKITNKHLECRLKARELDKSNEMKALSDKIWDEGYQIAEQEYLLSIKKEYDDIKKEMMAGTSPAH